MINYKNLADVVIDNWCDTWGADDCAVMLANSGFTEQDLRELGFDDYTINQVKEEADLEG